MASVEESAFRIEKERTDAIVTLTNGSSLAGHMFVAPASPTISGPERVADLLNSEPGFFPFEVDGHAGTQAVLLNRDHVVTVAIPGDEARRDSGYAIARVRHASLLLTDGRRIVGAVRVYRPQGRDRLSDWARNSERFRYVETADATFIVNVNQIVEVREVE